MNDERDPHPFEYAELERECMHSTAYANAVLQQALRIVKAERNVSEYELGALLGTTHRTIAYWKQMRMNPNNCWGWIALLDAIPPIPNREQRLWMRRSLDESPTTD